MRLRGRHHSGAAYNVRRNARLHGDGDRKAAKLRTTLSMIELKSFALAWRSKYRERQITLDSIYLRLAFFRNAAVTSLASRHLLLNN
jgi:hypothetical protein